MTRRRRRGALLPTLVVLGVIVVAFVAFAEVWTDFLWFDQLGFGSVLRTRLLWQALLFVSAGVVMAAAVWISLTVAYRSRPVYAPTTPEQASLDRYRETLEPLRRLVAIAVPATLGLFAGSAAAGQWQTVLLYLNRVSFGTTDAQFGRDIGFYVFELPFLQFATGFATAVLLLSGLAGLVTHYLYGGVRVGGPGERTTREAQAHLASIAALFLLVRAAAYLLESYAIMTKEGGLIAGPGYTDVNAVIPARTLLAVAAVLVALAFAYTAVRGNWRIPALGVGLLILVAVVAGGVLPQIIQRFQVNPSAAEREGPYIDRNIQATRAAYGLDDIETIDYNAELTAERGALADDARTLPGIRLLDPALVSPTFRQLEQIRQYYQFPDPLDVDRYTIDGETRDTVIAVRDVALAGLPTGQRNWVNDHTVYTHGFGVVAAYGNKRTGAGEPEFFQSGIPATGDLGEFQQRIYFGENSPDYSIVGAPAGGDPVELDVPDTEGTGTQQNFTYDGGGGVSMGDPFNRLLFAIRFRAEEILLSNRVNDESRVLFDRNPRERVEKVAPWLTLDGDPYPAVVDGEVLWIIDGYTTTSRYPYSRSARLDEATETSVTGENASVQQLLPARINYVRNSVKATVNAYTGEVSLYAWDAEDPLLEAWSDVFPGTITPLDEVSGDLMSHFRYPQDLFKVQRELLQRYHVTDASSFFSGEDYWSVPNDPTVDTAPTVAAVGRPQPPYYLSLRMPGQESPAFSLTSTFIPTGEGEAGRRDVLTGFLAADGDAGNEAGTVRSGYGQLRLLELRNRETIPGPGQIQNDFNTDGQVANELNILQIADSQVLRGNLLTLPIGGGLLYVQPVYVQSTGDTSYPLLRRVIVAFGEEIGFGETLDQALDDVFGGDSGANAPDASDVTDDPSPSPTPSPSATPSPGASPTTSPPTTSPPAEAGDPAARLEAALQDASQAIQDGEAALADGDFTAYGEAQDRLQAAIERALAAEAELTGEPVVPTTEPSAAPSSEPAP